MASFHLSQRAFWLQLTVIVAMVVCVYSDLDFGNDNCRDLSSSLGSGCTISDDCTKITCAVDGLDNKQTTVVIKINKCAEPITVDVTVKVPDLNIEWTHNFPSDAVVGVPGFTLASLAGVYIKVALTDTGSNVRLAIHLLAGSKLASLYPVDIKLVDSDLPVTTYECGIVRWWNNLDLVFKIMLIASGPVLLVASCICCYCCCCRNRRPQGGVVVMQTPSPHVITATKTNVPLEPFVNDPAL